MNNKKRSSLALWNPTSLPSKKTSRRDGPSSIPSGLNGHSTNSLISLSSESLIDGFPLPRESMSEEAPRDDEKTLVDKPILSFFDFDKIRSSSTVFKEGEIWALRDEYGMPRRYARILKEGNIKTTSVQYLIPQKNCSDWYTLYGFLHTCGSFVPDIGLSPIEPPSFSHKLGGWRKRASSLKKSPNRVDRGWRKRPSSLKKIPNKDDGGCSVYEIYPRKGEVWAVVATDTGINLFSDKCPTIKKYQMVEVLEDYNIVRGTKVAYLKRVEGNYRSLYRRCVGEVAEYVSPSSAHLNNPTGFLAVSLIGLNRFSHQLPSFIVSGDKNVDGCLELDLTSLPLYIEGFEGGFEVEINDNYLCLGILDLFVCRKQDKFKRFSIWSVYEHQCALPLRYVAIHFDDSHSQEPSFYNLVPKYSFENAEGWNEAGLHIASGDFVLIPTDTVDGFIFSHEIVSFRRPPRWRLKEDKEFVIYQRRGDVWAICKGTNLAGNYNPREALEYEFVEVLFNRPYGVMVAYLTRVEGFKCLFRRKSCSGTHIPDSECHRFSHQVPSHRFGNDCKDKILKDTILLNPLLVPEKNGDCYTFSDPFILKRSEVYPLWSAIQYFVDQERSRTRLNIRVRSFKGLRNCKMNSREEQGISHKDVNCCVDKSVTAKQAKRSKINEGATEVVQELHDNDVPNETGLEKRNCRMNLREERETSHVDVNCDVDKVGTVKQIRSKISEEEATEVVQELNDNDVPNETVLEKRNCRMNLREEKETSHVDVNCDVDKFGTVIQTCRSKISEEEATKVVQELNDNDVANVPVLDKQANQKGNLLRHEHNIIPCRQILRSNYFNDSEYFEAGQIWALYNELDGRPHSYFRINQLIPSDGKVEMKKLKAHCIYVEEMLWVEEKLPIACGIFRASKSTCMKEISLFSHRVICDLCGTNKSSYKIFPKRGQVWAIYENWDLKWTCARLKNDLHFKLVEVLSDFSEDTGVTVAALTPVDGREAVFKRYLNDGLEFPKSFSRKELLRFSHCIPSRKLTGDGQDDNSEGLFKILFIHDGLYKRTSVRSSYSKTSRN